MTRFEPYTAIGVKRVPCARCGQKPGHASWNVCADNIGNRPQYRVLCVECDIRMNKIAMEFVFGRSRDGVVAAYGARARKAAQRPVTKPATITTSDAVRAVNSYISKSRIDQK